VTAEALRDILGTARTIAVVGLSPKPARPSHGVARYLREAGYRIVPVNPHETEVLGERAYASLLDVDVPVDAVDVFRRPEHTPNSARDAGATGARLLWLQSGIVNDEARRIAEDAGLDVVMGVCIHDVAVRLEEEEPGR